MKNLIPYLCQLFPLKVASFDNGTHIPGNNLFSAVKENTFILEYSPFEVR